MKKLVSVGVMALILGNWAVAQEATEPMPPATATAPAAGAPDAKEGPCAVDRQKFCGDVVKGGGAIHKCMMEHQAELSEACQAHLANKKAKRKAKH